MLFGWKFWIEVALCIIVYFASGRLLSRGAAAIWDKHRATTAHDRTDEVWFFVFFPVSARVRHALTPEPWHLYAKPPIDYLPRGRYLRLVTQYWLFKLAWNLAAIVVIGVAAVARLIRRRKDPPLIELQRERIRLTRMIRTLEWRRRSLEHELKTRKWTEFGNTIAKLSKPSPAEQSKHGPN